MQFILESKYSPAGDQPDAIRQLVEAVQSDIRYNTLLGVTGSGKTFTVANLVAQVQKPTLVLSHNKTLAAQLYGEFKVFFPQNAIEYFVSYYDFYQPEAYLPTTDTYIEKNIIVNEEIERLRLSTTSSLMSGRRDVLVVSSVSCLFGLGNPDDFTANIIRVKCGETIGRKQLLKVLVSSLYVRSEEEFKRGSFRVRGDTVDVFVTPGDFAYRFTFFGSEIEKIEVFDPVFGSIISVVEQATIYPANIFVTTRERINVAASQIHADMEEQCRFFDGLGCESEAKRLKDRVEHDLEMLQEVGFCQGIENYSRYFDGRRTGERPFCLIDYFPKDFLLIVDESHATLPQVHAMFGGDHSRKVNLVKYGFRLPSAMDNRPLKFEEFEAITSQTVFVSATPADYELQKCGGVVVEQIVRPTGLLDPPIEVRPTENQIDNLTEEILMRIKRNERILVTTLTKRMAEELSSFLSKMRIKCQYIHADVDTLERVQIIGDFRKGIYDVLVGINLLREGLDLPEVSLVAILDADKEGFLRNTRSLTQTAGRAARHPNGFVIMYADKITASMQATINETNRRRKKQTAYNIANNITPTQAIKTSDAGWEKELQWGNCRPNSNDLPDKSAIQTMSREKLIQTLAKVKSDMEKSVRHLNFKAAAEYRNQMQTIQGLLEKLPENSASDNSVG